jgi:hypothetical protein
MSSDLSDWNSHTELYEVTAAVNDRSSAVDLYAFCVVRRVAVHTVDTAAVDEGVGESALRSRYGIAPVAAPVDRGDDDVSGSPMLRYPLSAIRLAVSTAVLADSSDKTLMQGRFSPADQANGIPLVSQRNANTSTRPFAPRSTIAAA